MNTTNKNQFKFYLLSFIAIFLLSFLVMHPSFNLAFEDEEWQGIVLPKTIYESYVTAKITSYSSPMWFMTNLYVWLGPNFSTYFILSFIFRTLLAFSTLVFIYILTKNKWASFMGGALLAVGFSGIQTTFEIINMIAYISYIGYAIFFCAFFLHQDKSSFKYLMVMGLSLLWSTILTSFRTYPLYAWVFIVDGLTVVKSFKKELVKSYLVRMFVMIGIFLVLYKIGIFSWYSRDAVPGQGVSDISRFTVDFIELLFGLNFNVFLNFLKGLGNIIFPDILDKSGVISLVLGFLYMITVIYLSIVLIKRRNKDIYLLFAFFLWPLLFYASYFLIYLDGHPKDTALFHSSLRYQFPPFIGLSITLAIFLSIVLKRKDRLSRIVFTAFIVFILLHGITTYSYLSKLSKQRDGAYMIKIWQQIKSLVPESNLSFEKMNVFYFETDGSARAIYTVNDGFIGHAIALYKIDSKPPKFDSTEISAFAKLIAPPMIAYEQLVDYVKESLSEGSSEQDIWNRIFALRVQGEKVSIIKEDVKMRVEASLNK